MKKEKFYFLLATIQGQYYKPILPFGIMWYLRTPQLYLIPESSNPSHATNKSFKYCIHVTYAYVCIMKSNTHCYI